MFGWSSGTSNKFWCDQWLPLSARVAWCGGKILHRTHHEIPEPILGPVKIVVRSRMAHRIRQACVHEMVPEEIAGGCVAKKLERRPE